jgi:putative transcriptional regulator
MIKLKLNEMLETRGMSAYALHVKSKKRLHQSVISKIKNNDSKALQLGTLDMLCKLLDCQPADLIVYESGDTTQSESTTQNVERATQSANTESCNVIQASSVMGTSKYYNKSALKKRGWTTGMIKDLYGKPDFFKPIQCGNMRPRYYYDETNVKAIESTNAFKERARKSRDK